MVKQTVRQTDKQTNKQTYKQTNNHLRLNCVAKTANRKFRIMYLPPPIGFLFTAPLQFEHRFYRVFFVNYAYCRVFAYLTAPGY